MYSHQWMGSVLKTHYKDLLYVKVLWAVMVKSLLRKISNTSLNISSYIINVTLLFKESAPSLTLCCRGCYLLFLKYSATLLEDMHHYSKHCRAWSLAAEEQEDQLDKQAAAYIDNCDWFHMHHITVIEI